MSDAILVLEDGKHFRGESFAALGSAFGEAVFNTGMTGYQETLTDPSYHRQVVVCTAPHIGNTGMNDEDMESRRIWPTAYVVRDPSPFVSNWRAERSLQDDLVAADVVGLAGVDTRALTRHLRDKGAMRVGVFAGPEANQPIEQLVEAVRSSPQMAGADLVAEVTTPEAYSVMPKGDHVATVVAVDLGIKAMTPELMAQRGIRVEVVPASITVEELLAIPTDGYFFSNGPGDPSATEHPRQLMAAVLAAKKPTFGICFGHQMFGRALGLDTYKLGFGHRGINQPVQDLLTAKVEVTAHNHGFAVAAPSEPFDTPFGRAQVTHVCLNDGVVEGLQLLEQPAFSVQYHPEAAAGPHDSAYLFDRFLALLEA